MRYRAPEIVLFDLEKDIAAEDGMLFGANAPMMIDPAEAITWIASERLSDAIGPLTWRECSPDELDSVFDRQRGRFELAEEIVTSAVMQGRVRCAYVRGDKDNSPVLSYVNPVIFEGTYVTHDWDEGLYFQIQESEEGDSKEILLEKFWFFWSEIVSLLPGRGSHIEEVIDAPSPSRVPLGPVKSPGTEMPSRRVVSSIETEREGDTRRGRGRPAGKNGEPIAMFVVRAQAEGVAKLAALTDEALGAMLREEYVRLGLTAPESTNAKRDARGALRALVKMQAKMIGGPSDD